MASVRQDRRFGAYYNYPTGTDRNLSFRCHADVHRGHALVPWKCLRKTMDLEPICKKNTINLQMSQSQRPPTSQRPEALLEARIAVRHPPPAFQVEHQFGEVEVMMKLTVSIG